MRAYISNAVAAAQTASKVASWLLLSSQLVAGYISEASNLFSNGCQWRVPHEIDNVASISNVAILFLVQLTLFYNLFDPFWRQIYVYVIVFIV